MIKKINFVKILLVSIFFSYAVGSGIYGYGVDYYAAYSRSNIAWGDWNDELGFRISSLNIYGFHLGVYIVSFFLSISLGILLKTIFKNQKLNSVFFFFFIYLVVLHTWPIIMSTSNGMRQGLAMSLIFLSFAFQNEKKTFFSFLFIFLSIFMNKSGAFFFAFL